MFVFIFFVFVFLFLIFFLIFILGKEHEERSIHVCPLGNMKSLHSQVHLHIMYTMFIFTVNSENYCQVAFPSSSTPWLTLFILLAFKIFISDALPAVTDS